MRRTLWIIALAALAALLTFAAAAQAGKRLAGWTWDGPQAVLADGMSDGNG